MERFIRGSSLNIVSCRNDPNRNEDFALQTWAAETWRASCVRLHSQPEQIVRDGCPMENRPKVLQAQATRGT